MCTFLPVFDMNSLWVNYETAIVLVSRTCSCANDGIDRGVINRPGSGSGSGLASIQRHLADHSGSA